MGNGRLFYRSEQWRVNVVIYFRWFGSTTGRALSIRFGLRRVAKALAGGCGDPAQG